jgi:type III pantothenate kinase
MILCLDCGNSRLKWGLRSGAAWAATGALPLTDVASIASQLPPTEQITGAVGCMVAAEPVRAAIEAASPIAINWIHASDNQCGVHNRYDHPSQLGPDRWAALIGARTLHDGPCVVVVAGTATTIDMLDATGVFQGGLILPGLDLMQGTLAGNTALLPDQPGQYRMLPRNSEDAIASGAINATLGAITRMFAPIAGEPNACCVLSGGAAEILSPTIDLPQLRIDNLALEGLARIAAAGSVRR